MLRSAVPLQQLLRRTRANGGAAALQRILLARLSTSCLPTRRFPLASCRACAVRFTPHLSSSAFSTSSTSSTPDSASPPADPSQPPSTPEPPPSDSSSPPSSLASPDPLSSPTPLTDPLTAELPASEDDPSSSVLDNPSSPYSFYRPPPADPGPPASPDAPWISRPPSYHYPASYPYDPVTDSIPLAPTVEGRSPRDESDEPEFPLPSLPPSSFLLPPPSPSYLGRRAGSFLDVYKHTVLLALTRAHHDAYGPSWTYVGRGRRTGGPRHLAQHHAGRRHRLRVRVRPLVGGPRARHPPHHPPHLHPSHARRPPHQRPHAARPRSSRRCSRTQQARPRLPAVPQQRGGGALSDARHRPRGVLRAGRGVPHSAEGLLRAGGGRPLAASAAHAERDVLHLPVHASAHRVHVGVRGEGAPRAAAPV